MTTEQKKVRDRASKNQPSAKKAEALQKLFIEGLKDILWAEKQLSKSLKKMTKAAASERLKTAFSDHLNQTEEHISRLARIFELMDRKPAAKKCEGMAGLIAEADEMIGQTQDGTDIRDIALVAAARKVEHYEISGYETLKTLSIRLGLDAVEDLLQMTLEDERETEAKLTEMAEENVSFGS